MYKHTITAVRSVILARYPGVISREYVSDPWQPPRGFVGKMLWILWLNPKRWYARRYLYHNIVWMCDRIETMEDMEKAGRWIGWVLAMMEIHGEFKNAQSRDLIRKDIAEKESD